MNQRKELERLCRYITRPAIANERLTLNISGQVVLMLKTPYRDGTTHTVMSLIPCSLLSILFITGLTFAPGHLSPEAPKRGKIFGFFVLTEPEYSHFSIDDHRV